MQSDWFNIALEIIFLVLIVYDFKKYLATGKKEYLLNVALTVVFAIWALYPYYKEYLEWNNEEREKILKNCTFDANKTTCSCIANALFKEYSAKEYHEIDKNSKEFKEFIKEAKEECLDTSWF